MPGVRYALKARRPDATLFENPTLGDRLRVRRQELGLQQKEAAAQVGADVKTWMWWERDEREPCISQYPAIIAFLNEEPWPEPRTLPERLLAYRRRNGLPIVAAARLYGADEGTWRRWERGEWRPQSRHRQHLNQLLTPAV